jgi:hypothetical protein
MPNAPRIISPIHFTKLAAFWGKAARCRFYWEEYGMRCSRLTCVLAAAMIVGTLESASAGSRSGTAAEFGAIPTFMQAVQRFNSDENRHTFKITDEFAGLWENNFALPSTPYRIAIAGAVKFALGHFEAIEGDSLALKKIFSSKMQQLLAARWGDKPSSPINLSSDRKEDGDDNRENDGAIENSKTIAGENASKEIRNENKNITPEGLSAYDRLFVDWTSRFLSNFDRSWQTIYANLLDYALGTTSSEDGFPEAEYAKKYGNSVVENAGNLTKAATEKTADPPEFDHNCLVGGDLFLPPGWNFGNKYLTSKRVLNNHFDTDVFFNPSATENDWPEITAVYSIIPEIVGSEKAPVSATNRKKTLGKHFAELFEIEFDNWSGAFRHIAAQISRLHEVF